MTLFFKSVVLSAFVAAANAENLRSPVRFNDAKRQLSYDFIAGYRPDSSVTDHVSHLDVSVLRSITCEGIPSLIQFHLFSYSTNVR